MDISLKGRHAVVCGSTQGIGLAIARELAILGAACTLVARNETVLQEVVTQLDTTQGQQHDYQVADFSQPAQVQEVAAAIATRQPVHILINNTGGPAAGPITTASPDAFQQAFQQHLVVNQLLVQAFLPGMKAAAYGRIINVISTSVKIPLDNLGVSNTIRAAVASWAKTLSNEVGQFNITVNNILPGFTQTQRLDSLMNTIAGNRGVEVAAVRAEMEAGVPMKRFGDPAETAAVAAFLASPAASYVNGVSIPVDGGRTGTLS